MKRNIFAFAVMLLSLVFSMTAFAAIPGLSNSRYMKTYGLSTANNTPVYRDAKLNVRGTTQRAYNATIYATDEIYVFSMNGTWAYISYPTGRTRSYGYIRTSAITADNYSQNALKSRKQITTYRRPGAATYGYISNGDNVWTVARSGNYTQVVYPVGVNYKMAWITNSDYDNYIASHKPDPAPTPASNTDIRGDVNSDGKVTKADAELLQSYLLGKTTSINKRNSDVNGDGRLTISDATMIIGMIQEQSNSAIVQPMKNMYCTWQSKSTWSWGTRNTGKAAPRQYHLGCDVYGTNGCVYAIADGTVAACSSSNSGANGRYIVIRHNIGGQTCYSFYAHLASINVSNDQQVSAGTQIAIAGGSANGKNNYYGTHLHFAIVDTLKQGTYYGYATAFGGDKVNYGGVTFYNPMYVLSNKRLP